MNSLRKQLEKELGDRFRIVRVVGKGGMATVFLAAESHPSRDVALKVLEPDVSTLITRKRFLREVDVAGNLVHPNIVPVYSAGQAGDLLYCVMPYIEGDSIRKALEKRGAFSMEEAVTLTADAALALDFAHSRGIVHRDVKPENILIAEGHALVADFGIAKAFKDASELQLTQAGVALGTPAYMSPEQARGVDISPASDIYSLGCVFFEMLTGNAPFRGNTAKEIMTGHTSRQPPRPRSPHGKIPAELERAVLKCLEKDPSNRFEHAAALAQAIQTGEIAQSLRVEREKAKKRPTQFTMAALIILAVLIGIWRSQEPQQAAPYLVVALDNQTGHRELDSLGIRFAEEVTSDLNAASLNSVTRLIGSGRETLLLAARGIGAPAVIHGSYYLVGDSLKFQLVVTNTVSGTVVGAPSPQSATREEIEAAASDLARAVGQILEERFETRNHGLGSGSDRE